MVKIVLLLKLKSLRAQLEYPANFLMQVVSVGLVGSTGILALLILTSAFPSIGGWDFWKLGFMMALMQMVKGVHHALFMPFWDHLNLVANGGLDRMLVRPVHPLLQIMANGLNLQALGEFLPGLVLFAITCPKAAVEWNLLNLLFLIVVVISGAVIEWAVYLFFATFDFWLVRASLLYVPSAFLHVLTLYPAHIYGQAVVFVLTFILPYAFMAYFPTLYFFQLEVEGFPAFLAYLTPLVAAVSTVVAIGAWSFGLRHYKSTGT